MTLVDIKAVDAEVRKELVEEKVKSAKIKEQTFHAQLLSVA